MILDIWVGFRAESGLFCRETWVTLMSRNIGDT